MAAARVIARSTRSSMNASSRKAPVTPSHAAIRSALGAPALLRQQRTFASSSRCALQQGTESGQPIAVLNKDILPLLPAHSELLFAQKKRKNLSFATLGQALGRDEVAVAAIFYGQGQASPEDVSKLAEVLDIPLETLQSTEIVGFPDRGRPVSCPPKDPLIYRLWEIVQNYGYPFKAVMNEKFGDGIMSAISFSTKIEKETDDKGTWCKITLRGKWLPYSRF